MLSGNPPPPAKTAASAAFCSCSQFMYITETSVPRATAPMSTATIPAYSTIIWPGDLSNILFFTENHHGFVLQNDELEFPTRFDLASSFSYHLSFCNGPYGNHAIMGIAKDHL